MNRAHKTLALAALLTAVALLSRRSLALDPAPAASPASAAPATPSASAASSTSAAPPAAFPAGDERTPAPKGKEWDEGVPVAIRALPSECEATRLREWVRVLCKQQGSSVNLIAGPNEGFSAQIPPLRGSNESPYQFAFPVRPGERRLIEFTPLVSNAYGDSWGPGANTYISIQWWPGEEPSLFAHR